MKRMPVLLFFAVSIFLCQNVSASLSEKNFYDFKKMGLYKQAFTCAAQMFKEADDDSQRMYSLFRIYEISDFPEISKDVLNFLSCESKKQTSTYNDLLADCIMLKLADETFNFKLAAEKMKNLGMLSKMNVYSPIKNSYNKFDEIFSDENKKEECTTINSSPSGKFDLSDLKISDGDIFILDTIIDIKEEGDYSLYFGFEGIADVFLNGEKILEIRDDRKFFYLQEKVSIKLPFGKQRLEIKTSSLGKNMFSCLIRKEKDLTNDKSFYQMLSHFSQKEKTGIVKYLAGFRSGENNPMADLEKALSENNFGETLYFMSLCSATDEEKDFYLRKALMIDKNHFEALSFLLKIKFSSKQLDSVSEILNNYKTHENNPVISALFARFYIEKKWFDKALFCSEKLYACGFYSWSHALNLKINLSKGLISEASKDAEKLFSARKSESSAKLLLETTNTSNAEKILWKLVYSFPEKYQYLEKYARFFVEKKKEDEALLCASSLIRKAPWKSEGYFLSGETYYLLGKEDLAKTFYLAASKRDPSNTFYSQALNVDEKNEDFFKKYMLHHSLRDLIKTASAFSDEPAVFLVDDNIDFLMADGSVRQYRKKVIVVNNAEASKSLRRQSFGIVPDKDFVKKIRCSIIRNGNEIDVYSVSRTNMSDVESRLYYDYESVSASFDDILDGDILVFEYEVIRGKQGLDNNYLGTAHYFSTTFRTLCGRYLLVTDKKVHLNYKVYNSNQSIKKLESTESVQYLFESGMVSPVKNENFQTHYSNFSPYVVFSSFNSWNDFAKWYELLLKDRIILTAEMKNSIDEITKGKTKDEKISAVYSFVTFRTRYVGFELGIGSFQPRKTDSVYKSNLGDCKDTALLLSALLNYCGIKSYIALVRTSSSGTADMSFPFFGNFNHAICFVDDAEKVFLDGTVQKYGVSELPEEDRGVNALIIKQNAAEIVYIDGAKYLPSSESIKNKVIVGSDGSAIIERVIVKNGAFASSIRESFERIEKKEEDVSRYWNEDFPGAAISNFNVTSFFPGLPLEYSYLIKVKNLADKNFSGIIFPAFIQKEQIFSDLTVSSKRETDIYISSEYFSSVETEFILPDDYVFISSGLEEAGDFKGNSFKFSIIRKNDNTMIVKYFISFKKDVISLDDYSKFRKYLVAFKKFQSHVLAAEKK